MVALALSDDAHNRVSPHADMVHKVAIGQIGRGLSILKNENVQDVVFIGKVPKIDLLKNLYKLDWTAIRTLSKLPDFKDDTIQLAMGDIVESNGFKVVTQSEFLRHLFPEVGVLSKRQPTAAEYVDIEFGFKNAKEIARLDIGQTVVVRDQMILAIEAIEGTDEAIKRAVKLAKGPVVVVKVCKPNQDQRFDIPTVGMNTLNSMLAEKPGGVLAIEARETLVVEQEEMIEFCDAHDIAMVAV